MRPEQLRRWIESRRSAEARERQELAGRPPSAEWSISTALSLIALVGQIQGWPPVEDDVSRRENEYAAEQWARLRRALGWRG